MHAFLALAGVLARREWSLDDTRAFIERSTSVFGRPILILGSSGVPRCSEPILAVLVPDLPAPTFGRISHCLPLIRRTYSISGTISPAARPTRFRALERGNTKCNSSIIQWPLETCRSSLTGSGRNTARWRFGIHFGSGPQRTISSGPFYCVTRCDSESWKFLTSGLANGFLVVFLSHAVTPSHQ